MTTKNNRFIKGMVFILFLSVFASRGYAQQEEQAKIRLAVVDFTTTDQKLEPPSLNQIVAEWLTLFLVNAGAVEVVERQELQKILQEQSLGQTGAINAESAAKLGELLGIKILVTGAVMRLGNTLEVTARLIDTSNGAIVGAFSVMAADVSELRSQIQTLAENMSRKLTGTEPGASPPKAEEIGVQPEEIKLRESFDGKAVDSNRWEFVPSPDETSMSDTDKKNTKLIQKDGMLTITGKYQKPDEPRGARLEPNFEKYSSIEAKIRVRDLKGTVTVGSAVGWNDGRSHTSIFMFFEENRGHVGLQITDPPKRSEIPVASDLRLNQWYVLRLDYKEGQFQYYWNGRLVTQITPNTPGAAESSLVLHFALEGTTAMTMDIDEIILR
jgi:TolB-like protein